MPSTMAKYLNPLPRGGRVIAHVLPDPENWHIDFLKHGNALAHDAEGCFLRSGHNDPAVQRHSSAKRTLPITRAWGQIQPQEIQFSPFDGTNGLLNGLHNQRSAPDHRLIAIEQNPHAH